MIYLDNAATSFPKPEPVHQAIEGLSRAGAGNPGRGMHRFAQSSEEAIREARRAIARLFSVRDPERVIFTLNATDALNMAIKGVLKPGDHAVTTDLEHNSVSRPLEGMAARGMITVTRLRSDDAGRIDPAALRAAMTPRTCLVAVAHASNVLGIAQDLGPLTEVAHAGGARLLVDASQSAGVLPLDLGATPIDLCAFTGHKALLGPMGTGGLVVREGVDVAAWREGGTGGDSSSPVQPEIFPHFLEGGTPNAVGLAGLGAGVRWVLEKGPAAIGEHERTLASRFARAIGASARVLIAACPAEGMPAPGAGGSPVRSDIGLVSFTVAGYQPAEVATVLDESFGIAVRAGLHCAPYIHRRRGLFPGGTVRVSAGPFSTPDEIDAAAAAVLEIAKS
jgi:cysteine desulfurase/selenocysteine lyase